MNWYILISIKPNGISNIIQNCLYTKITLKFCINVLKTGKELQVFEKIINKKRGHIVSTDNVVLYKLKISEIFLQATYERTSSQRVLCVLPRLCSTKSHRIGLQTRVWPYHLSALCIIKLPRVRVKSVKKNSPGQGFFVKYQGTLIFDWSQEILS